MHKRATRELLELLGLRVILLTMKLSWAVSFDTEGANRPEDATPLSPLLCGLPRTVKPQPQALVLRVGDPGPGPGSRRSQERGGPAVPSAGGS